MSATFLYKPFDSHYLPEFAVKKSMNSRQGARYIKSGMGADLKRTILTQNWISLSDEALRPEPAYATVFDVTWIIR